MRDLNNTPNKPSNQPQNMFSDHIESSTAEIFDFPEILLGESESCQINLEKKISNFSGNSTVEFGDNDIMLDQYSQNGEIDDNLSCQAALDEPYSYMQDFQQREFVNPLTFIKEPEEIACMTKRISKKRAKKTPIVKKSGRKTSKKERKRSKKRRRKKVLTKKMMFKKSAFGMLQTFALDMEDIFKFYPALKEKVPKRICNFPSIFSNTENFCVEPRSTKKSKMGYGKSNKTGSTRMDEECQTQKFSEVKDSLVRSKVNNMKSSMMCFEMTHHLRDMISFTNDIKKERRRENRREIRRQEQELRSESQEENHFFSSSETLF